MPPHYYSTMAQSMFAEWGLNLSEYSPRGVPSKKYLSRRAFAGDDDSCPGQGAQVQGAIGMKEATKRAASEALAKTLAVTAMLVIASFVFYWR